MFFLYRIANATNGKAYIGQTGYANPRWRWQMHLQRAGTGSNDCRKLYAAIRKHGPESFSFEVISTAATRIEIDALEIAAIEKFNTIAAGYNLHTGGASHEVTTETRALLSAAQLRVPAELKAARRAAIIAVAGNRKGAKLTPEHKAKLRAAMLGNTRRRGKPHSPEVRERIRQSCKIASAKTFSP